MKYVIKLAKGSLNKILQDSFNIILCQQLTHDRSYICHRPDPIYLSRRHRLRSDCNFSALLSSPTSSRKQTNKQTIFIYDAEMVNVIIETVSIISVDSYF